MLEDTALHALQLPFLIHLVEYMVGPFVLLLNADVFSTKEY
mgnify:CR=1 FL=1